MPPTSPTMEGDAANLRLGARGQQRPVPSSRPEPRGGTERREPHARCLEGWPVAEGATISGWREDRQAEGLGFGDHALVVGDQGAELARNACGRAEMDRVERSQWFSHRSARQPALPGSIASNRNPASTPKATAGM